MNINQEREILKKRLSNKEQRDAFVSAFTDQTIPFQIRAIREQKDRQWTQEELAKRTGMKQERISTIENPNYGRYSLRILKQLASAFDVALVVRFVPFSELAEWKLNLSSVSLEVPTFDQEDYFKEKPAELSEELLKKYHYKSATNKPDESSVPIMGLTKGYQEKRYGFEKEPSSQLPNYNIGGQP